MIKKLFLFLFIFLFTKTVYSEPLSAKFYTSTFDAGLGDTIILNLKINPNKTMPIYTVSASLFYNPDMMDYVESSFDGENWFSLNEGKNTLTDTTNGMIRRTGGIPAGADKLTGFQYYKFTAKKVGQTKVSIEDGVALDADNTDIGLQQKEITINIATSTEATSTVEQIKNFDVNLEILGPIAIYKEDPYSFQIYHAKKTTNNPATTQIYVYDTKSKLYYTDSKTFDPSTGLYNTFTIPANVLDEGTYVINSVTTYSDGTSETTSVKTIGVLSDGKSWITKHKDIMYPFFLFVLVLAVIHHIARDRDLYSKMYTPKTHKTHSKKH